MDVVFDPAKDAENIRKHGISLARAADFDFDTAFYFDDDSQDYGEIRVIAISWLDALLYTLVFRDEETPDTVRAISLRNSTRQRVKNMPKTNEPVPHGVPDAENPEWTKEMFARSKRFHELPEGLRNKLSAVQEASRRKRGPQKSPTKQLVSLRLSVDVLQALRDSGPGWQTRADQILRGELLKS